MGKAQQPIKINARRGRGNLECMDEVRERRRWAGRSIPACCCCALLAGPFQRCLTPATSGLQLLVLLPSASAVLVTPPARGRSVPRWRHTQSGAGMLKGQPAMPCLVLPIPFSRRR